MDPRATVDFETRSACPLRKTGSWRYSLDKTTEILCLCYRLPFWDAGVVGLWSPEVPSIDLPANQDADTLFELFDWIETGGLVEAHNAFFERGIWQNVFVPLGAPPILPSQWRCSAAKAAALSLPRSLDGAVEALALPIKKDLEGGKVMKKLTKPRKPRKKERETWAKTHGDTPHPIVYWESPELFNTLFAYCQQDVLAEEALSEHIPDLPNSEVEVYLLDQIINERGFLIDQEAVSTALTLIAAETTALNTELQTLTNGKVKKATQRAQMLKWFAGEGLDLDNTQKETIALALDRQALAPTARRGLEIVRELGRSSTAKYEKMALWMCPDDRVRGGMLYHGASTGRWSGAGVQPHNFPKGKLKHWDMEDAWAILNTGDRELIISLYGGVMEPLSQGLRGAITASQGKRLFVADYAAIEARVLLWLAREIGALQVFREGGDIYCDMATDIYGYYVLPNPEKPPPERMLGKVAILGLGYQMGASKFVATAATYGITITEQFAKQVVDAYRGKFTRVVDLWRDQQEAAIEAVESRQMVECLPSTTWHVEGMFLYCTLPSGRRLAYPEPEVRLRTMPWGAKMWGLTFMGVDALSRKWKRQVTYGGMLVENIVQAVARDVMAEALLRVEASEVYTPILSVHDEIVAEADERGDIREFERLVAECPEWADGCPIAVEGFTAFRYRK